MKKLCVIFGGNSSEHDISIITGMQLVKSYNKPMEKIYFGLDNKFYLATKIDDLKFFEDKKNLKLKEVVFYSGSVYTNSKLRKKLFDVECVINCCHGGAGENGELYSLLQLNGIKCTSANALSSQIAMNKNLTKQIVGNIVSTVKGVLVTKENYEAMIEYIKNNFSSNLIVKPNSLGSSIGVKACNKENFTLQIDAIFELNDDALVEERVVNMCEYNQACFSMGDGLMLSAIEQPLLKEEILSFNDKYKTTNKTKGRDRIIPAEISSELEEEIINNTSEIYKKLNMNGVVRIDYIFDKSTNTLYFNEINTIPGSLAFYLYEPIGIDYITLIDELVANAEDLKEYTYINTEILKDKKI